MNLFTIKLTSLFLTFILIMGGSSHIFASNGIPRLSEDSNLSSQEGEGEVFTQTFSIPESDGKKLSTDQHSPSASKICQYEQRVDFVHISSTAAPRAAQSHGAWGNVNCSDKLADVTTQIDRKNWFGIFYAVGIPGKQRLAPNPNNLSSGGGRVTAREVCGGINKSKFRSWTQIKVVGKAMTPFKVYSSERELACG